MKQHAFSRTELIIGTDGLNRLSKATVVVFGIGGVGSFSTEALVRSGVGRLILVDDDTVCLTNLNRQVHANKNTVGKPKVDVMKERILDINPKCEVITHRTFVTKDNISDIIEDGVDYVIDAIDTVSSKIALIEYCHGKGIKIISSMGTGNKLDPTKFKVTTIEKTSVCPLAKVMRVELRKRGIKKVKVLFSDELPTKPKTEGIATCLGGCVCSGDSSKHCLKKRQIPGSISFVPPVAGMIIGGEVIKDILGLNK